MQVCVHFSTTEEGDTGLKENTTDGEESVVIFVALKSIYLCLSSDPLKLLRFPNSYSLFSSIEFC